MVIIVGLPLRALPGERSDAAGFHFDVHPPCLAIAGISLPCIDFPSVTLSTSAQGNPASDWARWNYTGYENTCFPTISPGVQAGLPRVLRPRHDDVARRARQRMRSRDVGVRRPWLERYGTPMAPMLLSLFTDGCIGSMEGLYFESSTTTPFHFINQDELSTKCSCAQRNLPYRGFDISLGIKHMQLLGVRYYLASTSRRGRSRHRTPEPHQIAHGTDAAGNVLGTAWHIYEIADSQLVVPLDQRTRRRHQPQQRSRLAYGTSDPHTAPKDTSGRTIQANGPAMSWYRPEQVERVPRGERTVVVGASAGRRDTADAPRRSGDRHQHRHGNRHDRLRRRSCRHAGPREDVVLPELEGRRRARPVPRDAEPDGGDPHGAQHLHYGNTSVEYIAYLLTFIGIALAIFLARRPPGAMPEPLPLAATS